VDQFPEFLNRLLAEDSTQVAQEDQQGSARLQKIAEAVGFQVLSGNRKREGLLRNASCGHFPFISVPVLMMQACYCQSMLRNPVPALILLAATGLTKADAVVRLEPVVSGLTQPLLVTHAGDGSGRLFVVQKDGLIRIVRDGQLQATPFLDIRARVTNRSEMGLLGLAFHPLFASNGRFFVNYATEVGGPGRTVVAEYRVSRDEQVADPGSERVILSFGQPAANHNGGMLAFGPDGYLYISSGDGGGANDVFGNGQNLATLLGGILRIDVDGELPYAVPPDNPLVGRPAARPELWAWGLRNPWRMSFDRLTGLLFAGDVGQGAWEEIDLIRRGGNYGWNLMEGTHCFPPGTQCDPEGLILPIAEYGRREGISVTGGYVYRGSRPGELWGAYLFGDFGSGRIWTLTPGPGGAWSRRLLVDTDLNLSSFGEDEGGELYVVGFGGTIHRMVFGWREYFPHFADGVSSQGNLRCQLVLASAEDRQVAGVVRFRDRQGLSRPLTVNDQMTADLTFELGPGDTLSLTTDGRSDPLYSGWVEIEADGFFSGSLLYRFDSKSGLLLSEAGVGPGEPVSVFTAAGFRDLTRGLETGIALANPNSSEVTILLTVRQGGQEMATTHMVLGPNSQTALFLGELAALPHVFSGTIGVEADSPVVATLLRTLNGLPLSSLPVGAR
jgi:glucose/arabinose dehydrogenase